MVFPTIMEGFEVKESNNLGITLSPHLHLLGEEVLEHGGKRGEASLHGGRGEAHLHDGKGEAHLSGGRREAHFSGGMGEAHLYGEVADVNDRGSPSFALIDPMPPCMVFYQVCFAFLLF